MSNSHSDRTGPVYLAWALFILACLAARLRLSYGSSLITALLLVCFTAAQLLWAYSLWPEPRVWLSVRVLLGAGVLSNCAAVLANTNRMPVFGVPAVHNPLTHKLGAATTRLPLLTDWLPGGFSVGDLFLTVGAMLAAGALTLALFRRA